MPPYKILKFDHGKRRDYFLTIYPKAYEEMTEGPEKQYVMKLHERQHAQIMNGKEMLKNYYSLFSYVSYCCEMGKKEEKPHMHAYIRFLSAKSRNAVIKLFGRYSIHDCGAPRDILSVEAYIRKIWQEDKYHFANFQYGIQPTHIDSESAAYTIKSMVEKGFSKNDIYRDNPNYAYFPHFVNKLYEVFAPKIVERPVSTIWLYGKAGSGKSHFARNRYPGKTFLILEYNNGYFNNYTNEEVVIFDEFGKKNVPLENILKLTDKWVYPMNIKGQQYVDGVYKYIFLCGTDSPQMFCKNRGFSPEETEQVFRRITEVYRFEKHVSYKEPLPTINDSADL